MLYPVHERFLSFQGEGCNIGKKAFFIRLSGCPVKCPWCDSAGTWHNEYYKQPLKLSDLELAKEAKESGAKLVVVTGGEPTLYDLSPLVAAMEIIDVTVIMSLETSGCLPIKGEFDWITLSPKIWKQPLQANIERADEYKIIVHEPEDISKYIQILKRGWKSFSKPCWLVPEWSRRTNAYIKEAIVDAVKTRTDLDLRAGFQIHKLYNADTFDSRSEGTVPLGGNPENGY
jgi:7-carboxy-7-deazaguanine synthase